MHVKVGLSSNRATVSGQLYTLAQEMDMYSAMYDGQNMSDVLNDVVIAPQKAIYVRSPSLEQPWEDTTRSVYLIKADTSTSNTLRINDPSLINVDGNSATYTTINDTDQLVVELTGATIDTTQADIWTNVNPDYSAIDTRNSNRTDEALLSAILPQQTAEQVVYTVGKLASHASETDRHPYPQTTQTAYKSLSGQIQLSYSYGLLSAISKLSVDYPLITTSDSEMSLIQFEPDSSFGVAAGIGLNHTNFAQINILSGIEYFQGSLSSQLPRTLDNNSVLSSMNIITAESTVNISYPELTKEPYSNTQYFAELNLSKTAHRSQITTSASLKHIFSHTPESEPFNKFSFANTSMTIAIDYQL